MKITAKSLYHVLLEYRNYRNDNGMEPDALLNEIIETFIPVTSGSAKDAKAYLKSKNIEYQIKRPRL